MDRSRPLLTIDAPWLPTTPRPPLEGPDGRRVDPAHAGLQSAIISHFAELPVEPYERAAISIAIPDVGDVHAAGTMKLIIDAVKKAGFIDDDRNEVRAARLTRYRLRQHPTVNVRVLERGADDASFTRRLWPDPTPEPGSAVGGIATSYAYVSGRPGAAELARVAADPESYEDDLRRTWTELVERDAVDADPSWASFLPVGSALILFVPSAGNFDPDNVLLYVMDLLEVARRDRLGPDAGDLTIDQLVTDVAFTRHDAEGIRVELYQCDQLDEEACLPYFRDSGDIVPKWPDTGQHD